MTGTQPRLGGMLGAGHFLPTARSQNEDDGKGVMKIKRLIINNNIVVADGSTPGTEVLVMGKGIGFSRHAGDDIDEARVEKRYKLVDANVSNQLADLVQSVPVEHIELATRIMAFIE